MLTLTRKTAQPPTDSVALAYDERKRSRLKVTLASGVDAGIFLERGDHLHGGDRLLSEDGRVVVEVVAAPELLIEAFADDPLLFARAAYHLGNRHIPLQIVAEGRGGRLLFQTDHVLADMLRGLGCVVGEAEAPFQPEAGAYGAHGGHHHHGHDDDADDGHTHAHGHPHQHSHEHAHEHAHADAHSHDAPDLHNPGHGPHRSVPKIHQFKSG